jgi:WD40 repeat protein
MAGAIAPDGKRVAAVDPDGKIAIYPVDGGEAMSVPGVTVGERALEWLPDGKSLLIAKLDVPNVVYELEISSGKRKLFRTLPVPDGVSAQDLSSPVFSADFKSYVYSYTRIVSDLYVVDGLK